MVAVESSAGMRLRVGGQPGTLVAISLCLITSLYPYAVFGAGVLPSIGARASRLEALRPRDVPDDRALEQAGARIGVISVDPRNIFDLDLPEENTSLFRIANRLHIQTKAQTIRTLLLFRSGELYKASLLAESERILRATRFLQDARIRPTAWHDGQVDIEVSTIDVWTLDPGISFGRAGGRNTSGFDLEELNLLGLGKQIELSFKSNVDRHSTTLTYTDQQLFGSWWATEALFSQNSDGRARAFSLERPFYSLVTPWAAGFSGRDETRVDSLYDRGEIADRFHTHQRFARLYGGIASAMENGWTRRLSGGWQYDDLEFSAAPDFDSPFVPGSRRLSYPWLGFELLQDDYRKTSNRDLIERTEDFSLGWHVYAQIGYATRTFGADRSAVIEHLTLSHGIERGPHMVLLDVQADTRDESGRFLNSLAIANARYYFRSSAHSLLFIGATGQFGSRLDQDRQILLGGDNGLRGYPLRYQAGQGLWLFTAEQRFYTNWYPFRLFNVGAAVFYDMGRTWGPDPVAARSLGLLRDAGFGLRFGNNRSALGNVLHVDIAFPLDRDRSIRAVQFIVETRRGF